REVELGGDACGGVVRRCGGEHLVLPRRQRALSLGEGGRCERRGGCPATPGGGAGRSGRVARRGGLLEKTAPAPRGRAAHVAGAAERRKDERARRGQLPGELARGGDAVQSRHLDIEKGDVRTSPLRGGEDLVAAIDLGDDVDVVLETEQAREGAPDHRLV